MIYRVMYNATLALTSLQKCKIEVFTSLLSTPAVKYPPTETNMQIISEILVLYLMHVT